MANKKRNKKADIGDIIYIAAGVLVFAIVLLVSFKTMDSINTGLQNSSAIPAIGKERLTTTTNLYPSVFDNLFLFVIIGLCIVALALAFMVRVHPVFLIFFIIAIFIAVILAGIFSNAYLEIANDPEMLALADQMKFTSHLMKMLPIIVGIFGFILAIVMYKAGQG